MLEAQRCYYCFDAPCVNACPTAIDIPSFIRKISTGNIRGSAKDILSQNIMGGMCARVCPTEVLCEGVCVRNTQEGQPVRIGELQRYSTDWLMEKGDTLFQRAPASGKKVAVVGGGPAGTTVATMLARKGLSVILLERANLIKWLSHTLDNVEIDRIPKDPGFISPRRFNNYQYNYCLLYTSPSPRD